MKKITRLFILTLALLMVLPIAISASVPYATYTYSGQGLILSSPDAYVPDVVVDSAYMGLPKSLGNDLRDLFVAPDGRIEVKWERTSENEISLNLTIPENMTYDLALSDGWTVKGNNGGSYVIVK